MQLTIRSKFGPAVTEADPRLRLSHLLFLLFWVVKPFYLYSSGKVQPADLIFVASFVVWVLENRGAIRFQKDDLPLLGFVFCLVAVNTIYSLIYQYFEFNIHSAYYVYNLLFILSFASHMKNERFLRWLLVLSLFNIYLQLILLRLGMGQYMFVNIRYMGTYNDPNQFGFAQFSFLTFIFMLFWHLKLFDKARYTALFVLTFAVVAYLVYESTSTGILLGMVSFAFLFMLASVLWNRRPSFLVVRYLLIGLILAAVLGLLLFDLSSLAKSDNAMLERLGEKFKKVDHGGFMELIDERGIDKVILHPLYNLFGAGEGLYERFPVSPFEVHSTFPALLFYYGIIPFFFLIIWIRKRLRRVDPFLLCAILGVWVESFTLANQRQPAFWILIVFAGLAQWQKQQRQEAGLPSISQEGGHCA